MSQLDNGTFQQVKDLVLSGYHLNDIQGMACPTALLPQGTSVESLERFSLERFRFRGAMTTPALMTSLVTRRATPATQNPPVALLTLTT